MVTLKVKKGETYLLRIVNAAMNFQMYFHIAKHKLTVVETDCMLTKPYTTDVVLLAPGQTTDVLVTTDQAVDTYMMAASIFSPPDPSIVPYPQIPTTGLFVYDDTPETTFSELKLPTFPKYNDTSFAHEYLMSLRSLNSKDHPAEVPKTIDKNFFFTVGYSVSECPVGETCIGPQGGKVSTSVNNVTFTTPNMAILQVSDNISSK